MIDIQKISDADIEYLSEIVLDIVFSSAEVFDFSENTELQHKIQYFLDPNQCDFSCEFDNIHPKWWDNTVLDSAVLEQQEHFAQKDDNARDGSKNIQDPYANFIEATLISSCNNDTVQDQNIIVAIVLLPIIDPANIHNEGIANPVLQWFPEHKN